MWRAASGIGAALWLAMLTGGASTVAAQPRAGSDRLDAWIVTRYRGAQLFPDAEFTATSLETSGPRPRVETTVPGATFDTVVAVHFSAMWAAPALGRTARVQVTGPAGASAPVTARIVSRRAFRAPRTPGPSTLRPDSNWRYGWAYLAVVPHVPSQTASRLQGWLLLALPTTTPAP